MSKFQRQHKVLESLIRSWKHGHEVGMKEMRKIPLKRCTRSLRIRTIFPIVCTNVSNITILGKLTLRSSN